MANGLRTRPVAIWQPVRVIDQVYFSKKFSKKSFARTLIPRVVVPICQVSPTCARIWGRVSLREVIGSLRLFFLWIRGEEVRQVDLRFSVVLVPGCRGSHSSCIAVQVAGLWRLRQLCSAA
ncbi:hypothetical protein BRARA_B02682 [Brassica rapa]|uniref:Uncharacterized protein n=1 Tax=Brassica campestris TaxID=3711 RepID=A0A398AFI2_BRACM|nr:hypothetical protein BRARA_B02682 [Brassica rapa]